MGCCASSPNVEAQTRLQAVGGKSEVNSVASQQEAASMAATMLSGAANFTSKVSIQFSCKDLIGSDKLSKSDGMCVLFEYSEETQKWKEKGRTEVIANTHDPVFAKRINMRFNFEMRQKLKVEVYDADTSGNSKKLKLEEQDFLGKAEFLFPEIMATVEQKLTLKLDPPEGKQGGSTVTMSVEEAKGQGEAVMMGLSARKLPNSDLFGKSDPYLEIFKVKEEGDKGAAWLPVYRSEMINNDLNPNWKEVEVTLMQLCSGDMESFLKLKVYDYDKNGNHDLLGECMASAKELKEALEKGTGIGLKNSKKAGKDCGELLVRKFELVERPTFVQFIKAGLEINFMVAIDFTKSNGNPGDNMSLHYYDPQRRIKNQYETALHGIGDIIEFYDKDKMFPSYAFGAKATKEDEVSHCMTLTNDEKNPYCKGISEILDNYLISLSKWELAGPTHFAPTIRTAMKHARQISEGTGYLCLLILTDGEINDMPETKAAIIEAAELPMSILIVGVGDANFDNMEELDADGKLLSHGGKTTSRDIVQFVSYNEVKNDGDAVAKACLAELPGQCLKYMRAKDIKPPAATE